MDRKTSCELTTSEAKRRVREAAGRVTLSMPSGIRTGDAVLLAAIIGFVCGMFPDVLRLVARELGSMLRARTGC